MDQLQLSREAGEQLLHGAACNSTWPPFVQCEQPVECWVRSLGIWRTNSTALPPAIGIN